MTVNEISRRQHTRNTPEHSQPQILPRALSSRGADRSRITVSSIAILFAPLGHSDKLSRHARRIGPRCTGDFEKTRDQFGSDEFERCGRELCCCGHARPRHHSAALAPAPGRAPRTGLSHAPPSLAPALAAACISGPSRAVRVPPRRVPDLLRRVPRTAGSRGRPAQAPMRRQLFRLHVTTGTRPIDVSRALRELTAATALLLGVPPVHPHRLPRHLP